MKRTLFCLLCFFALSCLNALPKCTQKMAYSDKAALLRGETLVRSIKNASSCAVTSPATAALQQSIREIQPSYLAEVIKVVPYEGNEELISHVQALVVDIPSYMRIPYHSRWGDSPLFSIARIQEKNAHGATVIYKALLKMEPFSAFTATVTTRKLQDSFYYACTNEEPLLYRFLFDFSAIKKHKMLSGLSIFVEDDFIVLYALGGAKTPFFPFAQKRIESAFMNRITDFCTYFLEQL